MQKYELRWMFIVQSVQPHSVNLAPAGRVVKIGIKYPWRPAKCVACNFFGHSECSQRNKEQLHADLPVRVQVFMQTKLGLLIQGGVEAGPSSIAAVPGTVQNIP